MTKTSDQTLLAKMGFSDPDKKLSEHDLACAYVLRPEIADKILNDPNAMEALAVWQIRHDLGGQDVLPHIQDLTVKAERGGVEVPVVKGENQYLQYVGFVDAVLPFTISATVGGWESPGAGWHADDGPDPVECSRRSLPVDHPDTDGLVYRTRETRRSWWIGIEVKIREVPLGDALRQIKLYDEFRQFVRPPAVPRRTMLVPDGYNRPPKQVLNPNSVDPRFCWLLATRYDVSQADLDTLHANGVRHVRLGKGFDEYLATVAAAPKAQSVEI